MTAIVLGDANVDMVIRLPDRAAPNPNLSKPQLFGGGSAANAAVALARLGVPTAFVGTVGDDGYGRFVRDTFAAESIDTRGLRSVPDAFTAMVIAMVEPSGERWIVVWPPERGADNLLRPADLDRDAIAGATWLHVSGMCLRAAPVREAAMHAMQIAHEAGVPVSLDLNLRLELWGWADDIRATATRAVALSDVVLGNAAEEIAPLADVGDPQEAARVLADGQRIVVARIGERGALAALANGTITQAPAFPVPIVDTIGAGDAFDGGFIAARLAGLDVQDALRWGNAVAALTIQHPGARSSPTRDAVADFLARA